jgi:hypothetical protein
MEAASDGGRTDAGHVDDHDPYSFYVRERNSNSELPPWYVGEN